MDTSLETAAPIGASGRVAVTLDMIELALKWLGGAILAVTFVLVMTSVTLRYVFGSGLIWSEELAIWLNVLLVSVGAPLAVTGPLAMRLDVIVRFLPRTVQLAARVLADAIAIDASIILALGAAGVVGAIGGTSTVLGLPEWLRYAAVSIGGGLSVLLLFGRSYLQDGLPRALLVLAIGAGLYVAAHELQIASLATPSLAAGAVAAIGLIAGAPLPHTLLVGVSLAAPFGAMLPEPALVQNTIVGVSKFLLLAIPFFLLAGGLLTEGGLADRLVRFAASLVGHLRGGLAQTTLVSSVMFSGASGSSIANAAFGAKVMVPALVAHGYTLPRAAAVVAATAMLDNIIPPSIAFLILASATNLSVGSLLVGGFIAGGVLALALGVGIYITSRDEKPVREPASGRERARSFVESLPAIGLGIVVVVGIRFGVVTTTEASALAVAYALVVCLMLRTLNGRSLASAFCQAAGEAAAIGLLIGTAAPFAFLMAVDRVSDLVTTVVTALGGSALAVMLLANVVLLAAGLLLDIGAAILLLAPLLLPAATLAGIDPIQFGVILVVNLMIHGLTPPLGILVYVASGVSGARPAQVFREVVPLLIALLCALAVLCIFSALTAAPTKL
ncbi:ABC transporter permease [Pseudolabrys taiwanensis]|uniref:ABC transporter permease n=2 Tax=Pseudolabrys taiwanensis TaxID=331696 RepID=A0A346A4S1_9HYPH|nr:ABC transporter permease [Pseudolabrys taiwanensis]